MGDCVVANLFFSSKSQILNLYLLKMLVETLDMGSYFMQNLSKFSWNEQTDLASQISYEGPLINYAPIQWSEEAVPWKGPSLSLASSMGSGRDLAMFKIPKIRDFNCNQLRLIAICFYFNFPSCQMVLERPWTFLRYGKREVELGSLV